jgi:hypothetical protein
VLATASLPVRIGMTGTRPEGTGSARSGWARSRGEDGRVALTGAGALHSRSRPEVAPMAKGGAELLEDLVDAG